jgi:hypothetical protein
MVGPLGGAQDRHRFTFQLRTPSRTFNLSADSDAEMKKWIACMCHACGLKNMEEVNEGQSSIGKFCYVVNKSTV